MSESRYDWIANFVCDWIIPHEGLLWRILGRSYREIPNASLQRPVFACRLCGRAKVTTSVRESKA